MIVSWYIVDIYWVVYSYLVVPEWSRSGPEMVAGMIGHSNKDAAIRDGGTYRTFVILTTESCPPL